MKEHTKQIGEAINIILDEIIARDSRPNPSPLRKITGSGSKLMRLDEYEKQFTEGHFFIADPIGQSLRMGIREAGEILARVSGVAGLHEVVDFLSKDDETGRKVTIVDKSWDGIKDKDGGFWTA